MDIWKDLISDEMPDPLAYYEAYVHRKNEERAASIAEETRPRAFTFPVDYNLGHFLLHSLLEELGVREIIDILASQMRFQFSVYDMIAQLIFARVIYPCSKSKTVSAVFPPSLRQFSPFRKIRFTMALLSLAKLTKNISSSLTIAMSGIIRGISARAFLTARIITLRSICLVKTNRKGRPRRINTDPFIGQALLLDADLVPVAMQMYPGNESEKPYIRKMMEEMKTRYKVSGKTVQVADKGLNCARNIYAAVKEADDGYIFSKAIRGTGLSAKEKQWILLENDANIWEITRAKTVRSCIGSNPA